MKIVRREGNMVTYGGMVDPKVIGDLEREWLDEEGLRKWEENYELYRRNAKPYYMEMTLNEIKELDEPAEFPSKTSSPQFLIFNISDGK